MTIKIIDENTLEQDGAIFVFQEEDDAIESCCDLCYLQLGKGHVTGLCLLAPCASAIREDGKEGYFTKK